MGHDGNVGRKKRRTEKEKRGKYGAFFGLLYRSGTD